MNTALIDPVEASKLVMSLSVLRPRIDAVTTEFCRLLEYAAESVRLKFPSDERLIAVGIEEILETVTNPTSAPEVMSRYANLARGAGIDETHLPVLLASIQTAMAETAGYTWTDALEDHWTCWFDTLAELASHHAAQAA
jgi:hemoglobin-like flavoprotein